MTSVEPSKKKKEYRGALQPTARLWLARALLAEMRAAESTPKTRAAFWMSEAVCEDVGLKPWDALQFDARKKKLEKIVAKLEKAPPDRTGASFQIAALLGGFLGLSMSERTVLAFALVAQEHRVFGDVLSGHTRSLVHYARIAAPACGLEINAFLEALAPQNALARCRLVLSGAIHLDDELDLHPALKALLREPPASEAEAARAFVGVGNASTLELDDVPHLRRDVELACSLLKGAQASRACGVNLLLYGPPGTGKTETARLIAKRAGAELGEVPVTTHDAQRLGRARVGSYTLCQLLMARTARGVVLFDELEDALPRSDYLRDDKGHFVRLLEENAVPTIWTTNHVDHIDAAILRRFDFVVEMRVPPEAVRRRVVERTLAGLPIDESTRASLAADERLAPGVIARAARVARLVDRDASETVRRAVDASLKIVVGRKRASASPPFDIDLSCSRASVDLETLASAIERARPRVLLHGPPGTGKTAFVRVAAERSGRKLLVRRASDLLSCWVGETEHNIARMFDDARDEDAVLLLDEADSFLRGRADAQRSWEVTQVNEMLVQMEAFEGAFFCATNLIDALDPATFRRFDLKVRFFPPTATQRCALFERLVARVGATSDVDPAYVRARLERLDGLCPGHFAAVARGALALGGAITVSTLLERLGEERHHVTPAARVGFQA